MVAASHHNDAFDVPMLDIDAEVVVAEGLGLAANTETRQRLRARTYKKQHGDKMVVVAPECRTK